MGGAGASRPPTDSMGQIFPPGAPLRRGGVYPLKAGGAELRSELYGAERRGAPLLPPLRSGRRPHISPLVAFRKKEGSYFLAWRAWSRDWRGEWPFNARGPGEHGRRHGGWVRGAAGTLQAGAMYEVRCPLHFTAHQDCVLFRRLKFGRWCIDHGAPDREVCGQIARTFGVGPEEASTSQRRPGK